MSPKTVVTALSLAVAACLLSACSQQPEAPASASPTSSPTSEPANPPTSPPDDLTSANYVASLQPMNSDVTGDQATAEATFTVDGDNLVINIDAKGLPPDIEHWQHFHGFTDDKVAGCPTSADDANGDGIIDLIETEAVAGTTMVPFDTDPVAMDVAEGEYPHAGADGSFSYRQSVSMPALNAAFAEAFAGQAPDLDRRVIFIHGVVTDTELPESVASLGPIPAHVTLPIACGVIERVQK